MSIAKFSEENSPVNEWEGDYKTQVKQPITAAAAILQQYW